MTLPPHQHPAAPGKWPVVGEKAPRADDAPWTVTITGRVRRDVVFTLSALRRELPWTERAVDIHCVTRWSKIGVVFGGVRLAELLAWAEPLPEARFVCFVARTENNHRTSLARDDVRQLDPLIALTADDAPLETIHGGPVRVVTPNRYFYKSLKWLERIELLAEDQLGIWEENAGYHNHADPWQEERYIAPNGDRRTLERALSRKDFSDLDLRSVDLRERDLTNLVARGSKLRDVHFENAILRNADFTGANLSNAHLQHADLHGARFVDADGEGANFDHADLTGCDFTGSSLFGATFEQAKNPPERAS